MPSERVQISTTVTHRGVTVLTPVGELDFSTSPSLEAAITAPGQLPCVIVDFSHVTFLDSTGINALLRANSNLRAAGGWIRLGNVPATPLRVIRMVGLDQVIQTYPTLDAALRT